MIWKVSEHAQEPLDVATHCCIPPISDGWFLTDLKCVCSEWLDVHQGKWGPYFRCINCGNVNFKKGLEMNPHVEKRGAKKETTIRSDELDLF